MTTGTAILPANVYREEDRLVTAIWRAPFDGSKATLETFEHGSSVLDIIVRMEPVLPVDFLARGRVVLAGDELERKHWARIRPKEGQSVTLHYPLAGGGGGGGGGKQGTSIILAVATVLTAGLAAAGGFAVGGLFAAGELSARLLAGAISLAGALAQSALSQPPTTPGLTGGRRNVRSDQAKGPASISGNVLAEGADWARVAGTRRIFPALATQPITEWVGDDEYAEALFVLRGAHHVRSPRMGDAEIDDAADIEIQIREGLADDRAITLVDRYGHPNNVNIEMTPHQADNNDLRFLANRLQPELSLPVWAGVSTAETADEIWLHHVLPEGISKNASSGDRQVLPIRYRMKHEGSETWFNLPELHYGGAELRQKKASVKLIFGTGPEAPVTVPTGAGFVAAHVITPGQNNPASEGWTAHASFDGGSGGPLYNGGEGNTRVRNVILDHGEAILYLDPAFFPKGRWQIEMIRGAMFDFGKFTQAGYTYDGSTVDFFHYQFINNRPALPRSREGLADRLYLVSLTSVVNSHPFNGGAPAPGYTLIAVRVRNREFREFSVEAAGLCPVWDGEAFTGLAETSNPADHYHYILTDPIMATFPMPAEIVDVAGLGDWHDYCAANGHNCDIVIEGDPTDELLTKIAGCGYAMPYQSEVWGVIIDKDRSGEAPVQKFSERNAREFSTAIAFNDLPDAIRAVYIDTDGKDRNLLVWHEGREGTGNPLIEEIRYDGIMDADKIESRVRFDLKQAWLRQAFHTFKAPAEAIVCRAGSLIEVNQLMLHEANASARIDRLVMEDGELAAIILDQEVTLFNEPDMHAVADMHAIADMHRVGLKTALKIRRADSAPSVHAVHAGTLTGKPTRHVRLAVPVLLSAMEELDGELPIGPGSLVTFGHAEAVDRRLLVKEMSFETGSFTATITAVSEAPDLHL